MMIDKVNERMNFIYHITTVFMMMSEKHENSF